MKKIITVITFVVIGAVFNSIFGQSTLGRNQSESFLEMYDSFQLNKYISGLKEGEYEGSPYFSSDSKEHKLVYNGELIADLHIRYNIYNNVMELEKGGKFYRIPQDESYSNFIIGDHHFIWKNNFNNKKQKACYLEQLAINDYISLYKKHRVLFLKAKEPKGYQAAEPAKFNKAKPIYFISIKKKKLLQINSEKELLSLFPESKSEIKSFIKKNKLKFKKEDDLIKILSFANTTIN